MTDTIATWNFFDGVTGELTRAETHVLRDHLSSERSDHPTGLDARLRSAVVAPKGTPPLVLGLTDVPVLRRVASADVGSHRGLIDLQRAVGTE